LSIDGVIGWDVGGAHLKAALVTAGAVRALQVPCRLWLGIPELPAAIAQVRNRIGAAPRNVVTMTGEMADLFPSRDAGVAALVAEMQARLTPGAVRFYGGSRGMMDAETALRAPADVASANWRAPAEWAAARLGEGLYLDIGSTTTDIVPFRGGAVRAQGRDDASRLISGELVYTGVVRTPLMALAEAAPFADQSVPLMAELFATSADVYRVTGQLPEECDQQPATDGGAKTPEASARRIARMIGRDLEDAAFADWRRLAEWFAERQLRRVQDAAVRIVAREPLERDAPVVAAGVGRFLAAAIARRLHRRCLDFSELVPVPGGERAWIAACAPAVAVALLASSLATISRTG